MKYYAAINDEYLAKSIKDGSLAIFEEKKDAERVCNKMNYDLIEVSIVKHKTYSRLTEENEKLREVLERLVNPENCKKDIIHIIGNAESLLNQLNEQNNDK